MQIVQLASVALLSILVTACGGGGGDDSTETAVDDTPAIYRAANYSRPEVYDSSLQGTWVLVEKSTIQFDLGDFSAQEGFFEQDYYRRTLVSLFDDESGTEASFCMDSGDSFADPDLTLDPSNIEFTVGGFTFKGTAVNNNEIRGEFTGVNDQNVTMLNSEVTLHKIASYDDESEAYFDLGDLILDDTEGNSISNHEIVCFEQMSLSGDNYISGTLVSLDIERVYIDAFDTETFDDFSFVLTAESTAELGSEDFESSTVAAVSSAGAGVNYLEDSGVNINVENSSVAKLKGTVTSAGGVVSFDMNIPSANN
ncbi:MAG: hypothetical protein ACJA0N_000815 [Pseudohongiellaceae bacterium]|jgi:hypothetical protein